MPYKKIIAEFCHKVINEPLMFFSEADLQSLLFCDLMEHYGELIPTKCLKGSGSKGVYSTRQLHREYGVYKQPKKRLDMVILSKTDINTIDRASLKINHQFIRPEIAFELGTHKMTNYKGHLHKDVTKLSTAKKGFLIYLIREESGSLLTSPKQRSNSKNKFISTVITETQKFNFTKTVVPLIFIIELKKNNVKKIWGKCTFYDAVKRDWENIGLDKVYNEVLKRL